ncbi:hypothetical protein P4V58_29605, partial [Bacillus wiedmannii]|nr:hypothetical protein [Bacillus wiedmannii]
ADTQKFPDVPKWAEQSVNKQDDNHVVGVITDVESFYVTVTYTDSDGNNQEVDVNFPKQSNSDFKFKNGDKVKVSNKDQWRSHQSFGKTVFSANAHSISK